MKRLVKMAAKKESNTAPRTSASQSSCVDQDDDSEELDYLFLVKVKKGEKKTYAQFLLNEDKKVWEGPFDLDSRVHRLIRHNNTVYPNEDNWRLTKEKEVLGATEGILKGKQTYQCLSKEIRRGGIPGVGLKELLESERRKKERQELNTNIRRKDREVRE